MAKGTLVGVLVAVILAGFVVAVIDVTRKPELPGEGGGRSKVAVARIGPDGTDATFFGDDVKDAEIPNSRRYDLCIGELRVQRPPMMTSDMPDSFCSVTRNGDGPWRISTGGWQQCQAVCLRVGR